MTTGAAFAMGTAMGLGTPLFLTNAVRNATTGIFDTMLVVDIRRRLDPERDRDRDRRLRLAGVRFLTGIVFEKI